MNRMRSFWAGVSFVAIVASSLGTGCRRDGENPLDTPANPPKNPNVQTEGPMGPQTGTAPTTDGRFPPGPTRPLPTVQLEPLDLATSVGSSPLHVLVSNLSAPVGQSALEAIGTSITLKTWPELELVPVTYEYKDASGSSAEDNFAHVYLKPTSPLSDRWYALYTKELPAAVTWPAFSNVYTTKSGEKVTRFRVGSEPVIASIRHYPDDPKQMLFVDFSERVEGDFAAKLTVPGCQRANMGEGVSANSVRFSCPGLDRAKGLEIAVAAGLRSVSGRDVAARHLSIGPTDWSEWGEGGRIHKPNQP